MANKVYNLAIVGATGLVGQEFVKILEKNRYPLNSIYLYASDRSAGRKIFMNHRQIEVKDVSASSFDSIDIALFCAGAEVSRYFIPVAVQAGAVAIDSSSSFRIESENPMIVPEVNPDDITADKRIISNPNALTIQLVMVLHPLHRVNPVKRVVVSSYQSVSGIGYAGMDELTNQSKVVLAGQNAVPHVFPHQIAFNLLPETDVFMDDAQTREEWRLVEETRKVMHLSDLAISATCVRVPIYIGNSMAINIELSHPMSPEEAREILSKTRGIILRDDPAVSLYPHPWSVAGTDEVFVGRIRKDMSHANGLALWSVMDNLRKGSALNAVQIVREMVRRQIL